MKNKLLKLLLLICLVLPILTVFFASPIKTKASDELGVNILGLDRSDGDAGKGGAFQVMPGSTFQVQSINNTTTQSMRVAIYLYLRSKAGSITFDTPPPIRVADFFDIGPGTSVLKDVIINTQPEGDYTIRVWGRLINEDPTKVGDIVYNNTDLWIRSNGIVIKPDDGEYNLTSVKKGDLAKFKIKFYGLLSKHFTIAIDDPLDIRTSSTLINKDTFPYTGFSWLTNEGTSLDNHKIIVKTDAGITQEFSFKVVAPGEGGTTPSSTVPTFSITKLNNINIKTLLDSCKNKELEGIVCMIEAIIAWLLDIGMVISFIMILYAAAMYLTSYGEESKAELAKKTLIWSVIGVLVILAAKAIMLIIQNVMNNPSSLW